MLDDPEMMLALARYQVVSTYLAMEPKRGQRGRLRDDLARRDWRLEDGSRLRVTSGETIRQWVRRYRRKGLKGLKNKSRPRPGVTVLDEGLVATAIALKREVPERSLNRVIEIMEALELAPPGVVRRSTLHRVLRAEGLSARTPRAPNTTDLDRFEAEHPNDMWQSDMLVGPWLPDPERLGKVRRAYLYAFMDDHSRLLLHGRFSFKGDLPALELVFRRCLQKYGVCRKVYYDNGQVYRSGHMKQIVAMLDVHRIIHTTPYRPMGHGKIEALNRLIRSAFIAELKASSIVTLDALNEAFLAWADLKYNRVPHGETGETPERRWRAGIDRVRYVDEERLHQAFLWKERRKADKTGVFTLFGTRYQVGARLAGRRFEVRYTPKALEEVEVWHDDAFSERVRPLQIGAHRRPRAEPTEITLSDAPVVSVGDYLGHLIQRRRAEGFVEQTPRQLAEDRTRQRAVSDSAIVRLLAEHLHPDVFDDAAIRVFLERHGPFAVEDAEPIIGRLCREAADRHVSVYLDALRRPMEAQDD